MMTAVPSSRHRGNLGDPGPSPAGSPRSVRRDRPVGSNLIRVIAILAVSLFLVQGGASAATSLTPRSPARYAVIQVGPPTAPPTTLVATGVVRATAALAGLLAAGTQRPGTAGMAGTPRTLPACLVAACRDRYIVASPAGLIVRDFAERVTLTLRQPVAPPGVSTGFMVEIAIHTTAGWTVGRAYLATGTTPLPAGTTITLQLFVNLGTPFAPTILSVQTVVDNCATPTSCP